eukprot:jgi/Botrbrau1/18857/Bobra.177_2s0019.1
MVSFDGFEPFFESPEASGAATSQLDQNVWNSLRVADKTVRHSHMLKSIFKQELDLSASQLGPSAKTLFYNNVKAIILLSLLSRLQEEESKPDWEDRSRAQDTSNPEALWLGVRFLLEILQCEKNLKGACQHCSPSLKCDLPAVGTSMPRCAGQRSAAGRPHLWRSGGSSVQLEAKCGVLTVESGTRGATCTSGFGQRVKLSS